jgi:hypothetical protein
MYIIFDTLTDQQVAIVKTMAEVEHYMAACETLAWQPCD